MSESTRVYVFGDQTFNIEDLLSNLLHTYEDGLVLEFLERSCQTLKHEVGRLNPEQSAQTPRFSKLLDLLPFWRSGTLNPPLSQALTCICQLGAFLLDHGSASDRTFPTKHNACLAGLCTGSLSAAAVSCSANPSELLSLAVFTVTVAFRVGACAWDVGGRLCSDSSSVKERASSWTAALISGKDLDHESVAAALAAYAEDQALSLTSRPYISAYISPTQTSISAQPSILKHLLASSPFFAKQLVSLPIAAPYHAPHLYSEMDLDRIFLDLLPYRSRWPITSIPLISSTTGQLVDPTDFPTALRAAAGDCLLRSMRWDLVVPGIASHIRAAGTHDKFVCHPIAFPLNRIQPPLHALLNEPFAPADTVLTPLIPNSNARSCPQAKSKIAVIGMAGRFPRANSMESFWDVLVRGVDTHEQVPPSRWNADAHVNANDAHPAKNVSGTGNGCWLHDAAAFDARFFNMSPREAPQVDPAQRLALMSAAEALEQAGIVPGKTSSTHRDRIGVYFGCTSNDWMETNSAQDIDTYFIPGGNRAFIPGRINYHFKFSGPSYSIDTACSSSLAAIHMACNALWRGEVDTAIVGGTNILTNPDMTAGLDRGHFLSRTGNCRTFDETADGYCRGEAVVTAIFKRLDDAIRDSDPIQAHILSIATNHSAEADSITRPHVGAQQSLFEKVLAQAGVSASSINYVEMHGTGTQAGDATETVSVLETLAPVSVRNPDQPLFIGAAKANVGHGEAAAGITSLAKIILMLKHSTIPPHCGIKTRINSKIPDLAMRNTFIAKSPVAWNRSSRGPRRVLLNNFSAAGGNTALVIEEPAETTFSEGPDCRTHHMVAVSAKTPGSLQNNLRNMIEWIDNQDSPELIAKLSYTTTARRIHHAHRVMAIGTDLNQIKETLIASLERGDGSTRSKATPKFIFAFTGQGSHFAGMGVDLYQNFGGFKADIERYDQLCLQLGFPSIRPLFEDESAYQGAKPIVLQLVSVCLQMALFRLWMSFGLEPSAVVGHSLGEYPALYAAGVLSQANIISLVGQRAQLMQTACQQNSHAMLAVRSTRALLESILGPPGQGYEISCINGQQSVVLGGSREEMNSIRPNLVKRGLSTTFLEVPYAFHTSQVDAILDSLTSLARGIKFGTPTIPVISPTYGKVVTSSTDFGTDYVLRHCRHSVNMLDALNDAKEKHVLTAHMIGIEIGPAPVVTRMVKEVAGPTFEAFTSIQRGEDTWRLLTRILAKSFTSGVTMDWSRYHECFRSSQQCIELPAYSWELKDYWLQYVHDWSLRKGDPVRRTAGLETSSIHRVVVDTLGRHGGQLIVDANLSRKDLNPMVQGHRVYGVPLCTPSVYADIALTVGDELILHTRLDANSVSVEVGNMNIQSALVTNSEGHEQILRTSVQFDQQKQTAVCTFSSVDSHGKIIEQHAHCTITLFNTEESQKSWQHKADDIQSRMSALKLRPGQTGSTFRFSKSMIYRMVGQLADFDPNYRGLVEITLDNDALEATGTVSFKDVLKGGKFHTNPAYIDALSQLGGFVMNANETVDLDKEVFVNHGWRSLRIFQPIDHNTTYQTHVKMHEGHDKLWVGDVVVFNGSKVAAVFEGVALQGVPKRLMQYIVSTANKRVSTTSTSTTTTTTDKTFTRPSPMSVSSAAPTILEKIETTTEVTKQPSQVSLVASAMRILSEESGIAEGELSDDSRFGDIGVDSLMSLMVSSKLRDDLGIDMEFSDFLNSATIGDFKAYLRKLAPLEPITTFVETITKALTPIAESSSERDTTWLAVLGVISEESGIAMTDLSSDTSFADIGVDSLLSLLIGSRLRDELDLDLFDHSPFLDYPTVGDLQTRITGDVLGVRDGAFSGSSSSPSRPTSSPRDISSTPDSEPTSLGSDETPPEMVKPDTDVRPAWSIVLQGNPKQATDRLFLFPDGCGAATSYLKLPRISASTAVIGFNSPYMKHPHEMNERRLGEIVTSYIDGVRRYQPHGPYHLGGWSAGGVLAFAVAQELMANGEQVESLLLIDSPPPNRGLDRLPQRFFDHCTQVGIFGSELVDGASPAARTQEPAKVPDWLMPHFEATINLLHDYHAPPMPATSNAPRVTIMWAGACAFGDGHGKYALLPPATIGDQDTEGMKFLTEQRTDFGPGEWARLFSGLQVDVRVVEGHHFSIMRGEGAKQLAVYIREAMGLMM